MKSRIWKRPTEGGEPVLTGIALFTLTLFFPYEVTALSPVSAASIEEFLAASKIEELGIEQEELEFRFGELAEFALESRPESLGKLVLQTDRLIEYEQRKNGGWRPRSMWNGWTVMAEIMGRFRNEATGLKGLGMYIRIFREDGEGKFPTGVSYVTHYNYSIIHEFLDHGGDYDPYFATANLAKQLREGCGEGELVFLLPCFARLGDYLRPHQQREMLRWAEDVLNQKAPGDKELAECLELGLKLHLLQERPLTGEGTLEPDEALSVEAQILALFERDDLSPAWRQGLAGYISSVMPAKMSQEMRLGVGKLCTNSFSNDIPYSSAAMSPCSHVFLHADREDERWAVIARDLVDGWRHRNRYNGRSKREGLALDPSRYNVLPMVELSCLLRDEEAIDWHLSELSNTYGAQAGILVSLVRARYFKRALGLLEREAGFPRYRRDHYKPDPRFDEALYEAIPDFLKEVPNQEIKRFASALLMATPDPETGETKRGEFPDFHERLAEEAVAWVEAPLEHPEFRSFVLDMLAMADLNGTDLSTPLVPSADYFSAFDGLGVEGGRSSTEIYWMTRQHFHEALQLLCQGEVFPAQFFWGRLAFEEREDPDSLHRHGGEAIIDAVSERIKQRIWANDEVTLQRMLPFMRQLLESFSVTVYQPDAGVFLNCVVIAHAYCGEVEAFRDWWDQLDPKRQLFLADLLAEEKGLIGQSGSMLNPEKIQPGEVFPDEQRRREIYSGIAANPLVDAGYDGLTLMSYGYARELITENDIDAIAGDLANLAARKGTALREWFGVIADRGDLKGAMNAAKQWLAREDQKPASSQAPLETREAVQLELDRMKRVFERTSEP
ncbi:MAG: hypothetical protein AAGA96_12000 [Verrucomicrobiota bacterium]